MYWLHMDLLMEAIYEFLIEEFHGPWTISRGPHELNYITINYRSGKFGAAIYDWGDGSIKLVAECDWVFIPVNDPELLVKIKEYVKSRH